ncbi:MAG: putative Pyruvate dehydrogenase component, subunit beta [Bacteroidetes bacterium]|jgi:2-oxoisovalerate dehydrogenase E1 component beta subunit|nr:putative Pyruvate dehydrogenase component, subunit beta [Bacteroidota bacterium]
MAVMTYIEALSRGMWEEMERDPSVFLIGEDIGAYGGAFKATKGFLERFGQERVIDATLSEAAIVGASVGAALLGMRPVAEMQFADFVTCGFNQMVVNAAKTHYRWHLPVPMVLRLPTGGYIHGGPYHSTSPEAWFFHVPGLKIVAPSTPRDAKGLMKAAIRDDNPVIVLEFKYLYRRIKGEVPEDDSVTPIGVGEIRREGDDLAVITYGSTVHFALEAAERLSQQEGIEATILDLRSLAPFDRDLVRHVVQRTGKALVVHEDHLTGGVGAEIAAWIAEEMFTSLDAPVRRIGAADVPVPFAPPLEEAVLPNAAGIHAAMLDLARY